MRQSHIPCVRLCVHLLLYKGIQMIFVAVFTTKKIFLNVSTCWEYNRRFWKLTTYNSQKKHSIFASVHTYKTDISSRIVEFLLKIRTPLSPLIQICWKKAIEWIADTFFTKRFSNRFIADPITFSIFSHCLKNGNWEAHHFG